MPYPKSWFRLTCIDSLSFRFRNNSPSNHRSMPCCLSNSILRLLSFKPDEAPAALGLLRSTARLSISDSGTDGSERSLRALRDVSGRSTLHRPRIRCGRGIIPDASAKEAFFRTFAPTLVAANARRVWPCARFAAPVSMVRSPTETGEGKRNVDLLKSRLELCADVAIERWRIGPTGLARRAAFAVRSAPMLPVRPGCEIRCANVPITASMPNSITASSEKPRPASG